MAERPLDLADRRAGQVRRREPADGVRRKGRPSRRPGGATPRAGVGRRRQPGRPRPPPAGPTRGQAVRPRRLRPPRDGKQGGFDGPRPDVLPAGDDHVAHPAVDAQPAVDVELTGVTGGEPPIGVEGRRAVAVGPQQHRTSQPDLRVAASMATSTPGERNTVVHDPAAGFGQPIGGDHVRAGDRVAVPTRRAPRCRNGAAPTLAKAVATSDTSTSGPAGRPHRVAIEAGQHRQRGAGKQAAGDDGQSAHVVERQAGQPAVPVRDRLRAGRWWPPPTPPPRRG